MADYRILIEAETAKAEKDLRRVETVADAAARDRKLNFTIPSVKDATDGFDRLKTGIEGAANNIQAFYGVSKGLPVVGEKIRTVEDAFNTARSAINSANESINRGVGAGDLLSRTFERLASGADFMVNNLAKVGFALFGIQKAVEVLQSAFGSFFDNTIGREIELRATLLKTQTTVASMSDVIVNGEKLTDPLQKIIALTGSIEKNVDSIRERSLELAGVTSGEVVEVFGIVAGQIGQIGGGLKDAEDLAISFAAALGTFSIPLAQARQEITSMLQGNIGADSYLARALGITNADIAKARTEVGGVVEFIQKKLETAVAGQKLAAQSFSGVVSNIRELGELIGQKFGSGLLDPLLAGITFVYNKIGLIKDVLYDIAETAGTILGAIAQIAATKISLNLFGDAGSSDEGIKKLGESIKALSTQVFAELERVATTAVNAVLQVLDVLKPTLLIIIDTVGRLAKAFLEIKVGQFEAVVSALANIISVIGPVIQAIATLVNAWSRFLDLPILQYVSEVAAVLGLLKKMGLDTALMIVNVAGFMLNTGVPAIVRISAVVGGFIVTLGLLVAALANVGLAIAAMAGAFIAPAAAIPALQAGLMSFVASMRAASAQAGQTGTSLTALGAGMQAAGAGAKSMAMSLVASLGQFALIQIGIAALVDLFGRFQRGQQEAASKKELVEALKYLEANARNAAGGLDTTTKAVFDYNKAIATKQESALVEQLIQIQAELDLNNKLLNHGKTGIEKWWHEFVYGTGVTRDNIDKLNLKKKEIIELINRIREVNKQQAEEEAKAYANSPKGKIEQLQKELKVTQELAAIKVQEAANSIKLLQLSGELTEQDAQRALKLNELRDVMSQISAKQEAMSKIKMIDPSNTVEVQKFAAEIAALNGKRIDILLQLKREEFDRQVAELGRSVQSQIAALQMEGQVAQSNLSISQARNQAENTRLGYLITILENEKQAATTAEQQLDIAAQIRDLKIAQAENDYEAALAAIDAAEDQASVQARIARIEELRLQSVVSLAKAQGQLNKAHLESLDAAKQASRLAQENLSSVITAGRYQREAAYWTKETAIYSANAAFEAERTAIATATAVDKMKAFAAATKEAFQNFQMFKGVTIDLSGLDPWMQREINSKVENYTNTKRGPGLDVYLDAVAYKAQLAEEYRKRLGAVQEYETRIADQKAREEFQQRLQASYGFTSTATPYASGGFVTRPTLGLIGEAGEPEYVIPQSKMFSASNQFLSGARGQSVLSGGAASTSPSSATINITTGPVVQLGGEQYVTVRDMQNAMQATARGVLDSLRRPSTRISLGIS